ncbi:MAG: 5-formyltetrahydrofolate cyclo-ligase [Chlorobiaceae bacterium]
MNTEGESQTACNSTDRDKDVAVQKAEVRKEMIARRKLIPEKTRLAMSELIAGQVLSLPEVINARNIHLYLSIPDQAEVSTAFLVDAFAAMNKQLSVPVVREINLFSVAYQKGKPLKAGNFGQPEPEAMVMVDESNLDVLLMPLVAFDRKGNRIGYGKGFYDRFLQRLYRQGIRPWCIGLAFSLQMIAKVPSDHWDEPLDGAVHEHGIMRFT